MRAIVFLLVWLAAVPAFALPPSAEFGVPYAIRLSADGETLELFGSFSWAVPQNLQAVMARAPNLKTVRLDSPGGLVQAAIRVADAVRARGVDTYVPRQCASACTVVFLAGRNRSLAPDARLGFHQAHAPGVSPEVFDAELRATYAKAGVPEAFIDHVLRTPPDKIWYPTEPELKAAGLVTLVQARQADPPPNDAPLRAWWQAMQLVPAASDATLALLSDTLSLLLDRLELVSPETCWAFMHNLPASAAGTLRPDLLAAMEAAERRVAQDAQAARAPPRPPVDRVRILAELVEAALADGLGPVVPALMPDAGHADYCPAVRRLVAAARTLPEDHKREALRMLLASG